MSDIALDANFWEAKYQSGVTRWNLGQAAPPFLSLLRSPSAPQPGKMAVLGFGHGHDALLFAAAGFEVVGFDFAPSAIAAAEKAAQEMELTVKFLQRDIFDLLEFTGQFDYVLEHTCFCAIAPSQQPDYVRAARDLLRPTGELIGLFWAHPRPDGPPFGSTVSKIRQLFTPRFDTTDLHPVQNSVPCDKTKNIWHAFASNSTEQLSQNTAIAPRAWIDTGVSRERQLCHRSRNE